MWIFLNNAFLSIVDPKAAYGGGHGPVSDHLLVRARFRGDIERVFPDAEVSTTPDRDYLFRAMIPRGLVAEALAARVMNLDAANFKGSVVEDWRHDDYADVWTVLFRAQNRQKTGAKKAPRRFNRGAFVDQDRFDF